MGHCPKGRPASLSLFRTLWGGGYFLITFPMNKDKRLDSTAYIRNQLAIIALTWNKPAAARKIPKIVDRIVKELEGWEC